MAKAKPTGKTPKDPAKNPALAALRAKIDKIDRSLVAQMNERAKLAHKIGKIKEANGHQFYDPVREEAVLARGGEHSKGALSPRGIQGVFCEPITGSPG